MHTTTALILGGRTFHVDRARHDDLCSLVALLRDDVLGTSRENAEMPAYAAAFEAIDTDPAHLLVAVRERGDVVATLQLTLLPGLSRGGAVRLQIEAVRVGGAARGVGLGTALFEWAHEWGKSRGAVLAQLTTDATRADARRFYERLGYAASHTGMKRTL